MKAKDILETVAEALHGQALEMALDAYEAAGHAARVEALANICDDESAEKVVDLFVASGLIKVVGDEVEIKTKAPEDFVLTAKGGLS